MVLDMLQLNTRSRSSLLGGEIQCMKYGLILPMVSPLLHESRFASEEVASHKAPLSRQMSSDGRIVVPDNYWALRSIEMES